MTYSIVAFDPDTGDLGIGVQTHQPGVGRIVPWIKRGVGAVATQASVNTAYGPQGLGLLESGLTPDQAMAAILAADADREIRQVAIMSPRGDVATHTGTNTIPFAGHQAGENFSVQANMMTKDTVPGAMAAAFTGSSGALPERILVALEAAQAEGGDIRGSQSAAILVRGPSYPAHIDLDIRVDNSAAPLVDLRKLVELYAAQRELGKVTAESLAGKPPAEALAAAMAAHAAAQAQYPSDEATFWFGVRTLHAAGFTGEAAGLLAPLFGRAPQWRDLLHRLPMPGLDALKAHFRG
ncbi:MAG: DUF1028 domain-containing protein [Dehalococcoidia bacterium]